MKHKMSNAPVRVLHILGSLNRGGAETWFVQLLECMDRKRVHMDVLVHHSGGAYEKLAQSLGARVFLCEHPNQPLTYIANLKHLLREKGPYHVLHSHLQLYSGLVLRTAHDMDVSGRIAHARNSSDGQRMTIPRLAYRTLMRYWIRRYATHMFAVSTSAAEGAFGKEIVKKRQVRLLTGIDFSPFYTPVNRESIRAELGLSNETLVVGHVGSFRRQKNHQYLLKIAAHLSKLQPKTIFLLVGDGPLRQSFEAAVCSLGLQESFRLLGERNDVPRLLRAMDVFVFPSFHEGLPRVLLEAQAVGLPCVVSNNITPEVSAWPGCIQFLALEDNARVWAHALVEASKEPISLSRSLEVIRQLESREFSITANAKELTELYEKIASTDLRYDN